jgi:uncharacterized membrane protein
MENIRGTWRDVLDMLRAPIVGELDLVHLFVLTGIFLLFASVWAVIIHYVRIAASEV